MSSFEVKGRCPDAWRPMMAGDGLLVRVRPWLGRLTRKQVLGLSAAAEEYGSGVIDITRRANLQIRGVPEERWPDLIARLLALDLIDPDPVRERRRNILVAPDWRAGDDTARTAAALADRLDELPDLPAKVGFAIDAGPVPVLRETAADFRIERSDAGSLMLRAEGREAGLSLTPGHEVDCLIALAHWFVDTGGATAGRMARHRAPLPDWARMDSQPAPSHPNPQPGAHPLGSAYGLPYGQIEAGALAELMAAASTEAARITPWRIVIFEGLEPREARGVVLDPATPALRVDACPGQPFCPQATVETRSLASCLAPHIERRLHVSGCAKGCARTRPADVTLTGRNGGFDLILQGRAGDPPVRSALSRTEVLAMFGAV